MNYSGKTDPKGFFIGRDRFGSNIIVDFDRRAPDKTNASALILGNTGQGKSYLLKLLLCNVREAGKSVISLDSEHEMEDECRALGGCFLDYLSGQYRINLLEPRCWDDGSGPEDPDAPDAFRGTLLSQHISFLRDVFRVYKGFDTPHIDTLELMVESLYKKWNITDRTDFTSMRPEDYPILSDLYDAIQESYDHYEAADSLYPREMLRDLLLGLHSMCRGADARFFNGHTNIDRSKFLVFCVKGLDNMAENLRNTLLFSLLSYMSDQLLTLGNSVAAIDELYLWLSDPTVITYIRNALKRVRKKESALFLASQNLEDFTQPGIRELTRPLFSIPVHQFIRRAFPCHLHHNGGTETPKGRYPQYPAGAGADRPPYPCGSLGNDRGDHGNYRVGRWRSLSDVGKGYGSGGQPHQGHLPQRRRNRTDRRPTQEEEIRMIYVTGDCHGNFRRFQSEYFPEQANMTKDDTVIITGDFGGVWFSDSRDDETLDWLERLPFTLAFVCGNHENYDALERYPAAEWHGGKVHRIRPHVLHLMRGQIFELEGCRFFTMGGAKSHDIEDCQRKKRKPFTSA